MYLMPYDSSEHRIAVLKFVQTIPLSPTDPGYDIVAGVEAGRERFAGVPMLLLWGLKDFVFDRHFLAEWQRQYPHAEALHLAGLRALPARGRRRRGGREGDGVPGRTPAMSVNVASHLARMAAAEPDRPAVHFPAARRQSPPGRPSTSRSRSPSCTPSPTLATA